MGYLHVNIFLNNTFSYKYVLLLGAGLSLGLCQRQCPFRKKMRSNWNEKKTRRKQTKPHKLTAIACEFLNKYIA